MDIETKVAFLRRPEAYPDRTRKVSVIETHISWVFLTDGYAYKLKKPLLQPYLDFRTIHDRHIDALAEVKLNRRLAGDVYLGVIPLVCGKDDRLRLGSDARAVDWLVRMRRLPKDRMLDQLISNERLSRADLRKIGQRMALFYRGLPPLEIAPDEYRGRFHDDLEEYRRELTDPFFRLPVGRVGAVCDRQQRFLEQRAALFDQRVTASRIIEGHGDLRPEHLCVLPEPVVIDCLEFKRGFRMLDPADELAFLTLECQRLGVEWVGPALFEVYAGSTGDRPPLPLTQFYQSFRAMVRAKLAVWHNRDHDARQPDRWIARAHAYLALAERSAAKLS